MRRRIPAVTATAMTAGTVMALICVLVAGLLAPAAAGAEPAVHLVFLDTATGRVVTATTDAPATRTPLSPDDVWARRPAAAPDGSVVAYGVRTGPEDDPATTWGLSVAYGSRTRIVTDTWDTTPAIGPGGAVWWLSRGALWRYDPASAVTTNVCTDCVSAPAEQTPTGLAVSGTRLAVTFTSDQSPEGTLRVYSLDDGTASILRTFSAPGQELVGPAFSADGAQLALGQIPLTDGGIDADAAVVARTVLAGDPATWTLTTVTAGYSPVQVEGTWYVFTDDPGDELGIWSTPDLSVAPTRVATLANNSTTVGYAVTSTEPAAADPPTPLPAAATLAVAGESSGPVRLYGFRTCTLAACDKDYVRIAGVLSKSTNGRTWTTVATTNPYPYEVDITRTTRFVWAGAQTATLAAATSAVRTVVYIPTFTAGTQTARTVSGSFSRKKGTVVLQVFKKKKRKWKDTKVTAAMTKKGRFTVQYSFKHGKKYALRTVADARAGVGYSTWFRG